MKKEILNCRGVYEVSTCQNVISYTKYKHGKKLKKTISSNGYYTISIDCKNKLLHRIIATAFIPNSENLPCVNHKDGNKLNNEVSNLEWCSYSENNQHAFDTGLKLKGSNLYNSKINESIVLELKKLKKETKMFQYEMAEKFNISQSLVSAILNNKKWSYV